VQFCAGIGVISPTRDSWVSPADGRMRVFKLPTMPNDMGGVIDAVGLVTRSFSLMFEWLFCLAGGALLAIDLNRAGVTSPTISCPSLVLTAGYVPSLKAHFELREQAIALGADHHDARTWAADARARWTK
jgi:hypothetical protein